MKRTALLLAAAVALSGCGTIAQLADRFADVARGPTLEIVKNIIALILQDVTEMMRSQHELAVADVAMLRSQHELAVADALGPAEDLVFVVGAKQRLAAAEVVLRQHVAVGPGQRWKICLINNEKVLVRLDENEDSRVRDFADLSSFDLEKAEKVTGLFYAGAEPFRYYLHVLRAHL